MRDLRARLDAAERARIAAERKVDDLDNRVFLLTDQVESQKVALFRRGGAPALPVVTLRPPPPEEQPPAEEAVTVDESSSHKRPVLRLEGTPGPPRVARVEKTAPPSATASEGVPNLGVMKVRDRGIPAAAPAAKSEPVRSEPVRSEAPPVDAEPLALYREAYAALMSGRGDEAADQFRDFVRRFPRHDYADNAQYWLGETFYARKEFASAAPEFQAVVARWPSGNKAPDAMLKLGFCLLALGDADKGREVLVQVTRHYARTDAAQLAERRLAELPRTEAPK
jgi:tol-pal system protein YbgF